MLGEPGLTGGEFVLRVFLTGGASCPRGFDRWFCPRRVLSGHFVLGDLG